jgi:hypothetical protein
MHAMFKRIESVWNEDLGYALILLLLAVICHLVKVSEPFQ